MITNRNKYEFFEHNFSSRGRGGGGGGRGESDDVNVESFDADEEDGVRAPIPQRQDRMISPGYEGYALTRANPRLEMRMTSLLMTFVLTSCSESWSCIM